MKELKFIVITFVSFVLLTKQLQAQSCSITLHECVNSKSVEGNMQSKAGQELNEFEVPPNEHAIRLFIQVHVNDPNKLNVKEKLQLVVTNHEHGNEVEIHSWGWPKPLRNQILSTDCYFPAGEITLNVIDAHNINHVLASRTITIKPNSVKVANGNTDFPYNRTHFKIWTCKHIDDQWKPIQVVNKIKAGECVQLFFESTDKLKNLGFMRWGIYKLDAQGKEQYVNQKDQGIGELELWRRLSYEECDEFNTPGRYRIYIASKDDADVYSGVNNKNYFAYSDLIVE